MAAPLANADEAFSFVELPRPPATAAAEGVHESVEHKNLRQGLAEFLQSYVVNVPCIDLVLSPHYEAIAVTLPGARLAADPVDGDAREDVVGGCCYRVWPPVEPGRKAFIELSLIAVRHSRQGSGVGGALMRRLERRCRREADCEAVIAYGDNAAYAYFSRLGFSRTVTTPFTEWKGRIVDYSNGAVVCEKLFGAKKQRAAVGATAVLGVGGLAGASSQKLATGVTRCTSGRPNCYCRSGRTRAIQRVDAVTGEVLEEYCSTSDAARKLGLGSPQITHVLSGHTESVGGHKFRYTVDVAWVRGAGPKPIVEIDPVTGERLREFESSAHAGRVTGLNNSVIGQVALGKLAHVDGRIFVFRDPRVYPCAFCGTDHDAKNLLLCDGLQGRCQSSAHTYCIGMAGVPEGDWFCRECLANGGDQPMAIPAPMARPPKRAPSRAPSKRKPKPPPPPPARPAVDSDDEEIGMLVSMPAPAAPRAAGKSPRAASKKRAAAKKEAAAAKKRGRPRGQVPVFMPVDDGNENHCRACRTPGELICCDGCSNAYHLICAGLDVIPEDEWFCPVCVAPAGSRPKHPRVRLDL